MNLSSLWGKKSTWNSHEDFPNNEMNRCIISKLEMALDAQDKSTQPLPHAWHLPLSNRC